MVGTPAYMPLEVLDGKKWQDRSDVYSAGVVAFEIMTGLEPFPGLRLPQISHNLTKGKNVLDHARDLAKEGRGKGWSGKAGRVGEVIALVSFASSEGCTHRLRLLCMDRPPRQPRRGSRGLDPLLRGSQRQVPTLRIGCAAGSWRHHGWC